MFRNIENWHRMLTEKRDCWWLGRVWRVREKYKNFFVDPKNIDTENLKTHLLVSCAVVTQKNKFIWSHSQLTTFSHLHSRPPLHLHGKSNTNHHITYSHCQPTGSTGPNEWVKFSIFSDMCVEMVKFSEKSSAKLKLLIIIKLQLWTTDTISQHAKRNERG